MEILIGGMTVVVDPGETVVVNIPRYSLSGLVFEDFNQDGEVDFGELAIEGVQIDLADEFGHVIASTSTDGNGLYAFTGLSSANYRLIEHQPVGYDQGTNHIGTLGGSIAAVDQFLIDLTGGSETDGMNGSDQPVVVRLLPDGSLDSSFGSGGIATDSLGIPVRISDLRLQSDGSIVLFGTATVNLDPEERDFALVWYTSSGVLDTSF